MTIGQRIQAARKEKGFSQQELGELLGVSGSMIGQYENDLRKPKLETLQKIADALETSVDVLLGLDKKISNSHTINIEEFKKIEQSMLEGFLSDKASPYDIELSENLIETYFRAIKIWSEDKSFTPEETANIKEHFADLLLKYKLAINAIADIEMNNIELQNDLKLASQSGANSLLSESKIREEYFKKYAEKELIDLKNWAGNLAWYIAKSRGDKTPSKDE